MNKPKIIGRIDLETGKWRKKTPYFYWRWVKKNAAMLFCVVAFLYFTVRTLVSLV